MRRRQVGQKVDAGAPAPLERVQTPEAAYVVGATRVRVVDGVAVYCGPKHSAGAQAQARPAEVPEVVPTPQSTRVDCAARPSFAEDLRPPDVTKLVVPLADWLVVERSDPHNWTLMERKEVKSGPDAGRFIWRICGYYATVGQAAAKGAMLMMEKGAGPGVKQLADLAALLTSLEEKLRTLVELQARQDERGRTLQEVLGVLKDDKEKARVKALLVEKKR